MESFLTQGIIHVHGTMLWIAAITIISLEFIRVFRREKRKKQRDRLRLPVILSFFTTLVFLGSTGLFFLYEWNIWSGTTELDFWWLHSMILTWVLFGITFFLVDPLISET